MDFYLRLEPPPDPYPFQTPTPLLDPIPFQTPEPQPPPRLQAPSWTPDPSRTLAGYELLICLSEGV